MRWSLVRHITDQCVNTMTEKVTNKLHKQFKASEMKQDEEHFVLIEEDIINNATDTFDIATHPATLLHATAEVQCSLLESVTSGKKQVKLFVSASPKVGGTNSVYSRIKEIICENICSHEKVSEYTVPIWNKTKFQIARVIL